MSYIRIVIADHCPIVRQGLLSSLRDQRGFQLVGEATSGRETVSLTKEMQPNVVVVDSAMPDLDGAQLVAQIKRSSPTTAIVIFTLSREQHYAISYLRAGALGYVHKLRPVQDLIDAVRMVAQGKIAISAELAQQLATVTATGKSHSLHESLSKREQEIFFSLVNGCSVSNIADRLHLSPKTVSTHKKRVLQKLGIANLSELVRYALDHEILS